MAGMDDKSFGWVGLDNMVYVGTADMGVVGMEAVDLAECLRSVAVGTYGHVCKGLCC